LERYVIDDRRADIDLSVGLPFRKGERKTVAFEIKN